MDFGFWIGAARRAGCCATDPLDQLNPKSKIQNPKSPGPGASRSVAPLPVSAPRTSHSDPLMAGAV
ncbi:MAG: hypothetical protein HY690_18500 [Chloroflexi bacterium]|nr:hypothetical protein [Chloroflexota bacterium]